MTVNDIDFAQYPEDISDVTVNLTAKFNENGTYTMKIDRASADIISDIVLTDMRQAYPPQIEAFCESEGITTEDYLARIGLESMDQYVEMTASALLEDITSGQPQFFGCYKVKDGCILLTNSFTEPVSDDTPAYPCKIDDDKLMISAPEVGEDEDTSLFPMNFTRK